MPSVNGAVSTCCKRLKKIGNNLQISVDDTQAVAYCLGMTTIQAPSQSVAFAYEMIRTGRRAELIQIWEKAFGGGAKALRAANVAVNLFERKLNEAVAARN